MQLFKAFFKIARKHLLGISIYFILYMIIALVFGSTTEQNIYKNFQSSTLTLSIIDEDRSDVSCGLVRYLGSIHNLKELEYDPELLQDHIYYRTVDYILIVPSGFEENFLSGAAEPLLPNLKVPGSTTGHFVDGQISQYLQALKICLAGGCSVQEAVSYTDQSLSKAVTVQNLTFSQEGVRKHKEVFFFYRYLPYIFITLMICGLAPILITLQKKELKNRTSCSSLSLTGRNLQLVLGSTVYSLITWGAFQLIGLIVYRKDFLSGDAPYAMLNSFVFLLVSIAIALLSSLFSLNTSALNMLSNILGLSMGFLCGIFVDYSFLSDSVKKISVFLPAHWYTRVNDMLGGLSTEPFSLSVYLTSLGIQLLFAAAFFAITLALSRILGQKRQN